MERDYLSYEKKRIFKVDNIENGYDYDYEKKRITEMTVWIIY